MRFGINLILTVIFVYLTQCSPEEHNQENGKCKHMKVPHFHKAPIKNMKNLGGDKGSLDDFKLNSDDNKPAYTKKVGGYNANIKMKRINYNNGLGQKAYIVRRHRQIKKPNRFNLNKLH